MTLRVSFNKQLKELLKRHLTSVLILVIAFIIHFISVFMGLENALDRASIPFEEYTYRNIASMYSPHITNGLLALAAGAYMAFDYFKYLHSRKETDFYESLPITKSNRFFMNFISSFSVYALLLFVTLGAELIVGNVLGVDFQLIGPKALWNFVCMIGIYLVSWVTSALAMVMTGHPIVAIMGYGAFSIYFPVLLYNLIPAFASNYFETYVNLSRFAKFNYWNLFFYLSPASLMYKTTSFYTDYWNFADHKFALLGIVIFTLFVGYLAYYLFHKRSAETAGRAMAFEKANSVIRILIVVPLALYLGLFLKSMSINTSDVWLIFGIILTGFICHGLIQGIFESDIKAAFTKKKQLLITYLICFAFLSIFKFDLLQFDNYIPKLSKVEKIYIETDDFSDYLNFEYSDGIYGEELELVLKAANEITQNDENFSNDDEVTSILFKYQLKNGLTVSRSYLFDKKEIPKSLDELSVKESFKDDYCMFYKKELNEFNSISYTYNYNTYTPITGYDLKVLIDTYIKEFTQMSFSELYNEPVLYRFYANYDDELDEDQEISSSAYPYPTVTEEYETSCAFNVYGSFTETIKILNNLGYVAFADNEELVITSLEVYSDDKYSENGSITDVELLAKLKKHAYLSDFNRHYDYDDMVYGWANVKSDNNEFHCDLYFEKSVYDSIINASKNCAH